MMQQQQDPTPPGQANHPGQPVRMMEIGPIGSGRRWGRWVAFILFYLLVAALLIWVFSRFGATLALAAGLVGFMIAYMVLIGAATGRNLNDRR